MNIEQQLKSDEAAKFLRFSRQTLCNWRHTNRGPAYIKLGGSIRYRVTDLVEFIERSRIQPEVR